MKDRFICAVKRDGKRENKSAEEEEGGTGRNMKGVPGYVSKCQPDSFHYFAPRPEDAKTPPTHKHTQIDKRTVSYPQNAV